MELKTTLKVGDVCLDCQQQGLAKYLRNFKLNLHGDTLLKCESNECMYPYNDDLFPSSDEDEEEYNGLKLIDDLFDEINNESKTANSNDIQLIEDLIQQKDNKPLEQFEMSFLNALEDELKTGNFQNVTAINENDKKINNSLDIKEDLDDKTIITKCKEQRDMNLYQSTDHSYKDATTETKELSLPLTYQFAIPKCKEQTLSSLPSLNDNGSQPVSVSGYKTKVEIQSIKTFKTEPLNDNLPTTSSKLTSKTSKSVMETLPFSKSTASSTCLLTKLNYSSLPAYNSSLKTTTLTKSNISASSSTTPSSDIPKANITGRQLLEQIKKVEKTTEFINPKRRLKIKNNFKVKLEPLVDDLDNNKESFKTSDDTTHRSIDDISKLLNIRKLEKRKL